MVDEIRKLPIRKAVKTVGGKACVVNKDEVLYQTEPS